MLGMIAGLSLLVGCATSGPMAASQSQTVFVMRHLQKAPGDDSTLSQTGAANAQLVAEQLGDRNIVAVFVTDTRRARETAAPLAARASVTPQVYDPRAPDALVAQVREINGDVLVVGHSNTVPAIIAAKTETSPAVRDTRAP